jgi:hypothetical protein
MFLPLLFVSCKEQKNEKKCNDHFATRCDQGKDLMERNHHSCSFIGNGNEKNIDIEINIY